MTIQLHLTKKIIIKKKIIIFLVRYTKKITNSTIDFESIIEENCYIISSNIKHYTKIGFDYYFYNSTFGAFSFYSIRASLCNFDAGRFCSIVKVHNDWRRNSS